MRGFVRRASALYFANAVNGVLGIAFVPIAVHRLGTSGYGLFSIYSVIAGYVILIELGLGKNLVRLLGKEHDAAERLRQLRLAAGLYMCVCGVLVVLAPLLAYVVPRYVFAVGAPDRATLGLITLLAVVEYVLGVPSSLIVNHALAQERFTQYSRFVLASGITRYGLAFAALVLFPRPELVVAAMVSRRVLDWYYARALVGALPAGSWRATFDMREFRILLGHSSVLALGQALQSSIVAIGSILVNATLGLSALGSYRAVFDLATKLWFFSNVIGFVVFPTFVRMLAAPEQRERLRRALPELLNVSWMIYALIGLTGGLAAPYFLRLVHLSDTDLIRLFVLLVAGVSFNAHMGTAYEFVQAWGKYTVAVAISAASLALMLLVYFVSAGWSPALAIGWAWLVSQAVMSIGGDVAVLVLLAGKATWVGVRAYATRIPIVLLVVASGLPVLGLAPSIVGLVAAGVAAPIAVHTLTRLVRVRTKYAFPLTVSEPS